MDQNIPPNLPSFALLISKCPGFPTYQLLIPHRPTLVMRMPGELTCLLRLILLISFPYHSLTAIGKSTCPSITFALYQAISIHNRATSSLRGDRGVRYVFIQYLARPRGSLGTPSPRIDTKITAPMSNRGTRTEVRIRDRPLGVVIYGPPGSRGVRSDMSAIMTSCTRYDMKQME